MTQYSSKKLWWTLVFWVVLAVHQASACSVCFSANPKTRIAFYATTVILSALPMMAVGGFVWWYRRQTRTRHQGS